MIPVKVSGDVIPYFHPLFSNENEILLAKFELKKM